MIEIVKPTITKEIDEWTVLESSFVELSRRYGTTLRAHEKNSSQPLPGAAIWLLSRLTVYSSGYQLFQASRKMLQGILNLKRLL